jgi:hypothetical protein
MSDRALQPWTSATILLLGGFLTGTSEAATIRVPADAPTIQAGIAASANGDTVLVAPGTYFERINFLGKAITVASEQGPELTTIDGRRTGTVVTFLSREGRSSVLSGFTIRGGFTMFTGAGIQIGSSSPTIRGNIVTDNTGCSGIGISSTAGAPRIEGNKIVKNAVTECTGAWGIGIYILGSASGAAAEIVDNEISDNTSIGSTSGGGVGLFGPGAALLRANAIRNNMTVGPYGCGWGGGIAATSSSAATIVDNLIVGNYACFGGGVDWGGIVGTNVWINNTVAGNTATLFYPGVHIQGYAFNQLFNNVFTATSGPALFCETNPTTLAVLTANDVFTSSGAAYAGNCADPTGTDGNISADPSFIDPAHGDYRLLMTSPAIDAGSDAAPSLPATDITGTPRIVDGNGDGLAHIDMGAFEYHNHAPVASAGDDQTIVLSGDCSAIITLHGAASDSDGDSLTFTWTGSFGSASGTSPTLSLPAGTSPVTLTVTDGNGGFATDTVVITVLDKTPPTIVAASATPSVITTPNHNMVPIVVNVSVSDCSAVSCRIVSVTSNEPQNGTGDGDTSPDWQITGDLTLQLRAERSGTGSGRAYTITIACVDASGNETRSTVTVRVPRNTSS